MTPDLGNYFLTTIETARLLGIQPATLRSWRHNDREPVRPVRIGAAVLYPRDEVSAYLARTSPTAATGGDAR